MEEPKPAGKRLDVIVRTEDGKTKAIPASEQPAAAAPQPPPARKESEMIDDRIGVSFKDGLFTVAARMEERVTPEYLVKTFETIIIPRARQIDMQLAALNDQRQRAAKEVAAWYPEYVRAKKMLRVAELERKGDTVPANVPQIEVPVDDRPR